MNNWWAVFSCQTPQAAQYSGQDPGSHCLADTSVRALLKFPGGTYSPHILPHINSLGSCKPAFFWTMQSPRASQWRCMASNVYFYETVFACPEVRGQCTTQWHCEAIWINLIIMVSKRSCVADSNSFLHTTCSVLWSEEEKYMDC